MEYDFSVWLAIFGNAFQIWLVKYTLIRSDKDEAEFQYLKTVLVSPDITLFIQIETTLFEAHTDTSKTGCSAMLAQYHGDKPRPICFASHSYSPH